MLTLDAIPIKNPLVSESKEDGEVILYSPNSESAVILRDTSLIIWALCDGESSVSELIELLEERFPDHREQIQTDVVSTVQTLLDKQLLHIVLSQPTSS